MNRKNRRASAKSNHGQDVGALVRQAFTCHDRGALAECAALLRQAIGQSPADAQLHSNLGIVLQQMGRGVEALAACTRAAQLAPALPECHFALGGALAALGRAEEAAAAFARAVALKPAYVEAQVNLGNALRALGRFEEAVAAYRQAAALAPEVAAVHANLGNVLAQLGRADEAIAALRRAVGLAPGFAEGHSNLGNALTEAGRLDDAVEAHRRAVSLAPAVAELHFNLADALARGGLDEEAIAAWRRALALKPDYADAHYNLGNALSVAGRLDEALAAYRQAAALAPDHAESRYNGALALLLKGDWRQGWEDYEYRWRRPGAAPRRFEAPQWDGAPPAGRTLLLLHAEQGLGDTIQFARFAASCGGPVVLEVQPPLVALLQGLAGTERVVAAGAALPPFDSHLPLMSVPRVLGLGPDRVAAAPYLTADPERVSAWRRRLGDHGFKIGIVWQGNPDSPVEKGRSIPLACFAPLARVAGTRLISLQKNHGCEQLSSLPAGMAVETLGDDFDAGPGAFLDTAAVMQGLDLVVTSDTAAAHLAGALGRPVWIVLKRVPDWRWLMDRDDSPWYPTARLFRQRVDGDWGEPFARIARAAEALS